MCLYVEENFMYMENLYSNLIVLLVIFLTLLSGIQTSQDARFYGLSTKFDKFSNEGKTLVLQFTVKHEQNIDCGGGYIKVFDCSLDQKDMHGETPYLIMFGKNIKYFIMYIENSLDIFFL